MKIWDLFQGYERAHGRYEVTRTNDRGKATGRAKTILSPATPDLWEEHLSGTGAGIGIIPLMADNHAAWGALDIDVVTINHPLLEKKVIDNDLPLIVARSKSGGAHCFVFFTEPAPAEDVRNALERWAAVLGYGGCEVFPKQTSRYNADQDVGNWLNMPYYNAAQTLRFAIKDGKSLSLDDFLTYAESKRISPDDLRKPGKIAAGDIDDLFSDGPPCLQHLHANGGFPEGTRNDGMYNVAVYLKKRFADDWEARAQEYNVKMCSPPLSLSELSTIVKSINRKKYGYRCKLPPIAPHCQKRVCMTRPCGVGDSPESAGVPLIGDIVQYQGDPVLWFLDVDGKRIMLTTDELFNPNLFAKKLMDHTRRVPGVINGTRWRKFLDELLQKATPLDVPEEATPTGQFKLLTYQYLCGQAQASSQEELVHRFTPYRNGAGVIWFRSRGLLDYLANHNFKVKSEHHVYQMLRSIGGTHETISIKGTNVNVWSMPEPEKEIEEAALPKFGQEEF